MHPGPRDNSWGNFTQERGATQVGEGAFLFHHVVFSQLKKSARTETHVKNVDTQSRVAAVNNVQVNFHLQDTCRSKATSCLYANPQQGIGVVIELREEHAVVSEPE